MWPQRRPHQFVPQVSLGVARNRDIVWLCAFETCSCCTHRQPRPVLDAIQPLLLQGDDKLSVSQQSRRRIAVERVKSENSHLWFSPSSDFCAIKIILFQTYGAVS